MFGFIQRECHGAYRETHARANLDRKRPRIVAQPHLQLRFARKKHAVEDERFIANRVECSHLGFDLFALLRLAGLSAAVVVSDLHLVMTFVLWGIEIGWK
jgi:hypothetical protein